MGPSSIETRFAPGTKRLIGEAREVALDLGWPYISSLHLVLADGRLNGPASIRAYTFADTGSFERFYKGHRQEKSLLDHLGAPLPLTLEAENVIRRSATVANRFGSGAVLPAHLILAGLEEEDSDIAFMFRGNENLAAKLQAFYADRNALQTPARSGKAWWKRLFG